MKRVNMLRFHNITPILVFDGCHLPSKETKEAERRAYGLALFECVLSGSGGLSCSVVEEKSTERGANVSCWRESDLELLMPSRSVWM